MTIESGPRALQAKGMLPSAEVTRMSNLSNIDLVIFDCDGVLIDSELIASRTMAAAMRAAGADITATEAHIRFTGNSLPTIRRIFAEDYGLADVDRLIENWYVELYREFEISLAPMPGADVPAESRHMFFDMEE